MKKIIKGLLFGITIFCAFTTVHATTYPAKTLIPVDTVATVETDLFTYQDFVFQSAADSQGNASMNFNQIINRTDSKIPISINVLLFNDKEKNIGFVTYCTDKDYDTDYNRFKIGEKQSVPFSISITPTYFASYHYKDKKQIPKSKKYTASEVKYIAVLDDNPYCQIGGYDNYVGKKLYKIIQLTSSQEERHDIVSKTTSNPDLMKKIIFGVVGFVCFGLVFFVLTFVFKKIRSNSIRLPKRGFDSKKNKTTSTFISSSEKEEQPPQEINNPGDEVIDLGYHGKVIDDDNNSVSSGSSSMSNVNDLFNISQGESLNDPKLSESSKKEVKEEKKKNNNKEGESDLSKFFK